MSKRETQSSHRVRDGWIDITRGVAILLLLFLHATNIPGFRWGIPAPDQTLGMSFAATPFRMPLLFFASGLLLHLSLKKSTYSYFAGKLRNLGWPYILWALVLLNTAGFTYFILNYATNPETWLATGYLWFIFYLFFFYVAARVLYFVPGWAMAVFLLLCASAWPEDLPYADVPIYGFYFFFGHAISSLLGSGRLDSQLPAVARGVVFVGFAILAAVSIYWSYTTRGALIYDPAAAPVIASSSLFALLLARRLERFKFLYAVRQMGENSIVYYLTHWPVMIGLMTVLSSISTKLDPSIYAVTLFVGAIVIGATLTRLRKMTVISALFSFPEIKARRASSTRAMSSSAEAQTAPSSAD